MAIQQIKFLGASVTSVHSGVGWNNQSSGVTIQLIEDKASGDRFTRPEPGTPVKFGAGAFFFEGLIQRWLEKKGFDGNPVYEVVLTDPREIVAGCQVILSKFRGPVSEVPNLLNVFGYFENSLGFGGSMATDSGMLWSAPYGVLGLTGTSSVPQVGILPAVHALTSPALQSAYGGRLEFKGYRYRVDLSGLPTTPVFYRLPGVSMSLLDIINQVCQDGGCDYICNLKGDVITFKCVSRVRQPEIGQIANFVNSQPDTTADSAGLELRNEATALVLLGGNVLSLYPVDNPAGDTTIWPFWGLDIDGSVIMGQGVPENGQTVMLNASVVADVLGDVHYKVDIPELRCAAANFDSWAAYVLLNRPDVAQAINLVSAIDTDSKLAEIFSDVLLQRDVIAEDQTDVKEFGQMNESDYWTQRVQRVYEFVKGYATDYFGKRFLVRIPFKVYWQYEAETTHVVASDEPADAGYTPDGSMPLGLKFLNEIPFIERDGRFRCFVRFSGVDPTQVNLQNMPHDGAVLQDDGSLYLNAQIDQNIGIVGLSDSLFPYVVVNLPSALYELPPDPLGGVADIAKILNVTPESLAYATGLRYASFPLKIGPAPIRPDAVALPMKSNRDSYGPWSIIGAPGKVSLRRDESLTPWNYGGYGFLDQAAKDMLADAATNQQLAETGSLELVGLPQHSLGDTLVADGPNITGIDISIGTSGITTSYRMQTYTPKLGAFAKANADRLKQIGLAQNEIRRDIRALYARAAQVQQIETAAEAGFLANTSRAVAQATPHEALVANVVESSKYGVRTQVASETGIEALANMRGDNDEFYKNTAVMSLEGLLRPYSTNQNAGNDSAIPHFEKPAISPSGTMPTQKALDPLGDKNDIDLLAWGDSYSGFHTKKANANGSPPEYTNARMLGLRGPLMVVGYGFDCQGKPVPNSTPDAPGDKFLTDYRLHPESWKAGPVSFFWDSIRKVWTIPTFLVGTLTEDGGSTIAVRGTDVMLPVDDVLGGLANAKAGTPVVACFDQVGNRWIVSVVGCAANAA